MNIKQELNFNPAHVTVLVIDDHPQMRKAMLRVLASNGFTSSQEAGTGSEGIKILKDVPVDLVICDLYLLDVSGFDVLEFVRNRDVRADIPFIVVTGEASKEEIVKAADRGANDYLLKPFKGDDLQIKVNLLLKAYHQPSEASQHLRNAERYYLQKNLPKALELVDKALGLDGTMLNGWHLKAIILNAAGQTDLGLKLLQQVTESNSSFYRSYAAMADIYLKRNSIAEAIDCMERELELNPRQPRRQTQIGTLLLEFGRVEDAMKHFREALKENVKYLYALFGMGKAYGTAGNLEKAIYYYKRVRRYFPTNTKCLEAIVKCCLDAGDSKRAEYALKDEKNTNKNRLDTYLVLSKLYIATEEKDKALLTIDELLTLKPDSTQAMKMKAAIHIRFQEYPAAVELYKKVLTFEQDAETLIQYADVLIKCGQYLEAIEEIYKAMSLSKDSHTFMARLATCYTKTNQITKAYIALLRLQEHVPLNEALTLMLAEARTQINRRRQTNHNRLAS